MRQILWASLAILLLCAGGCGPKQAMTLKEFKGFCYQYGEGDSGTCDTIGVCDPYAEVINKPQGSRAKCIAECEAIHGPQVWKYDHTTCLGPAEAARDWCVKFCRSAYPE